MQYYTKTIYITCHYILCPQNSDFKVKCNRCIDYICRKNTAAKTKDGLRWAIF